MHADVDSTIENARKVEKVCVRKKTKIVIPNEGGEVDRNPSTEENLPGLGLR